VQRELEGHELDGGGRWSKSSMRRRMNLLWGRFYFPVSGPVIDANAIWANVGISGNMLEKCAIT
jgi:hypothetical protein